MAPAERICPVCRGEFAEGIESCPDCGVVLSQRAEVEPGVEPVDEEELVPLVQTTDATLLPVLTGLLESAGIPSVVHGADQAGFYLAMGKLSNLFRVEMGGARLMVARRDLEEAQAIVAEIEVEGSDEGG